MEKQIQTIIDRFDSSFFFYDLDGLKKKLENMQKDLDPDIKLWYACKANPMSAIIKVLRNLNFGLDIASEGELHQVLNTGVSPKNIIATGPGKSKAYLRHLLENGVKTIVLESINQAYWLDEVAKEFDLKVDCLLRIQLDWNDGKSVLGGDEITPFGIAPKDWLELELTELQNLNILGFHSFQWGNILEVSKLETIWATTIEAAQEIAALMKIEIQVLDLGGGLGVPYDLHSEGIDFDEVKAVLGKLKNKYKLKKIWMELGRYISADAGKYITKIIDKKCVRGRNILVCEGGINHIARVALVNQAFPATALYPAKSLEDEYYLHGPLCTALDFLGKCYLPSTIDVDDWVVFHQAGAYGFTESMPYFLCHKLAGEVISYGGDLMIPRPPKTSYDWMI